MTYEDVFLTEKKVKKFYTDILELSLSIFILKKQKYEMRFPLGFIIIIIRFGNDNNN